MKPSTKTAAAASSLRSTPGHEEFGLLPDGSVALDLGMEVGGAMTREALRLLDAELAAEGDAAKTADESTATRFELLAPRADGDGRWSGFARRIAGRYDRGDEVRIEGKDGLFVVEARHEQSESESPVAGVCLRRLDGDGVPAEGDVCVRASARLTG